MAKALVVDDSRTIRVIIRRILLGLGYEVCEAGNGIEALQVLETEMTAVCLVLTDWNMPEMNGLDLVKQIRLDAALAALKIIMITTETEMSHMVSALEAGANEYVMKPFTREILQEKLELIGMLPAAGE